MAWQKYAEYIYPTELYFEKILVWMDSVARIYFAMKIADEDDWTYFSGTAAHGLSSGSFLVNRGTTEVDAQTNYWKPTPDSDDRVLGILPGLIPAKYIRIYVDDANDNPTVIHEFRPSTYFAADEIITGHMRITDDFTVPPLLTVTKDSIDRIELGNFTGSTFGLIGRDDSSQTIFELSDNQTVIAGWNFNDGYLYSLGGGAPGDSPTDALLLRSSDPVVEVYEAGRLRVSLGYLSAGVFGIKGYDDDGLGVLFELSDTQMIIAGWTISPTTLANGTDIVLDASNKAISINDTTFGNAGIQLEYNGGSPQVYVGDGSSEFFQYTTAGGVAISTAESDGITIKSGGGISVEDGGDIVLAGHASDPAKIIWSATPNVELSSNQIGVTTLAPVSNGGVFKVGADSQRFSEVLISADGTDGVGLFAWTDSSNYGAFYVQDASYIFEFWSSGINYSMHLVPDAFRPDVSNRLDLGTNSLKWKDLWLAGDMAVGGDITGDNIIISDAGYIGSVSDTDAMQIEADGDVVFSQNVGIGISPIATLHLAGSAPSIQIRELDTSLELNQLMGAIEFYKSDTSGAGAGVSNSIRVFSTDATGTGTFMVFTASSAGGNDVESFKVESDGSVVFSEKVTVDADAGIIIGEAQDFSITVSGNDGIFTALQDQDIIFRTNDGGFPQQIITIQGSTSRIGIQDSTPSYTLDINGTFGVSGLSTFGGNIIIPDAGHIGSASDTDAIQIEADGDVVFSQNVGIGITPGYSLHLWSSSADQPTLMLENTFGAGSTDNPVMTFYRNTAAPSDNMELGRINGQGNDSEDNDQVYSYISFYTEDITIGDTAGSIKFYSEMNGNLIRFLVLSGYNGTVDQGDIIFNDNSRDIDFLIKSNVSSAFFVEGSSGIISIGDGGTTNYAQFAANGDLSFAGTARIDWTKVAANGVTLGDGPPTSGDTVADLQTAHDGNTYTVDEKAASAGQNLIVDFTGVTAFNWVEIISYYDGQQSHELQIQLEVAPFDGSAWHDYNCMNPDNDYMSSYSFFVPDDAVYINGGVVKIRFLHNESGNANDDWIFNVVALYQ